MTYDNPVPFDRVQDRLLLHDHSLALEAAVLLAEAALHDGIRSKDHVVLLQLAHARLPGCTVPHQRFEHVVCMQFNLVPPLHDSDGRAV